MSQAAKVQEPSMEEILASIRRIIADDDAGKPAKPVELAPAEPAPAPPPQPAPPKPAAAAPPPPPPPPAPEPPAGNSQEEVDAMLAEFEAPPQPAEAPPPMAAEPPPVAETQAPDVFELTEAMTSATPSFRTIDAATDVVFTDQPPEPAPRVAEPPVSDDAQQGEEGPQADAGSGPFAQSVPSEQALLSSATAAAVDSAFHSLAHTVLGNNARTLEDLVQEMLRPMLKNWLDDNLPSLVERIVRAEIERVSRGRP